MAESKVKKFANIHPIVAEIHLDENINILKRLENLIALKIKVTGSHDGSSSLNGIKFTISEYANAFQVLEIRQSEKLLK